MKIFCIGYNKTGTTSLYHSIVNLGFKNDLNTMEEGEFLMPNVSSGNINTVIEWIKSRDDIEVFKDVPFSLPYVWKSLYESFPDAIYILSERDSSKQWCNSITKFHRNGFNLPENTSWEDIVKLQYRYFREDGSGGFMYDYMSYTYGKETLPYDQENLIRSYESHNEEVKEFFKDKDNFISINVSDDNDYLRLCSFLGKEPVNDKFLKLKVTQDRETW